MEASVIQASNIAPLTQLSTTQVNVSCNVCHQQALLGSFTIKTKCRHPVCGSCLEVPLGPKDETLCVRCKSSNNGIGPQQMIKELEAFNTSLGRLIERFKIAMNKLEEQVKRYQSSSDSDSEQNQFNTGNSLGQRKLQSFGRDETQSPQNEQKDEQTLSPREFSILDFGGVVVFFVIGCLAIRGEMKRREEMKKQKEEREERSTRQLEEIARREEEVNRQKQELKTREAEVNQKEQNTNTKQEQIQRRAKQIDQREAEVKTREEEEEERKRFEDQISTHGPFLQNLARAARKQQEEKKKKEQEAIKKQKEQPGHQFLAKY